MEVIKGETNNSIQLTFSQIEYLQKRNSSELLHILFYKVWAITYGV